MKPIIFVLTDTVYSKIVNANHLHLDLADNNLTLFESNVFKKLLENMARWGNTGSIRLSGSKDFMILFLFMLGLSYIPFNALDPFKCDCHLAWLVIDNRHLLNYVKGARCASNGYFFKDRLLASKLINCDNAKQ